MATRVFTALAFCLLMAAPAAALTVRFDTNVGNIDLVLNTTNPNLKPHVDNLLAYVDAGRYDHVVLNRADDGPNDTDPADDFVLQFGGFTLDTQQFSSFSAFTPVEAFDPIFVDFNNDGAADFDTTDLSNTRGTVSLALIPGQPNSGTSSFFVNLGDNSGLLDVQAFVPFAKVVDMSTVDYIMRLNQVSDPSSGSASNIPVIDEDNLLVFVERAYCLDCDATAPTSSSAISTVGGEDSSGSDLIPPTSSGSSGSVQVVGVPEPPALVLAVGAFMVLTILKGPRRY